MESTHHHAVCVVVELSQALDVVSWICSVCFCKHDANSSYREHFMQEHWKENMLINTSVHVDTMLSPSDTCPVKVSKHLHYVNDQQRNDHFGVVSPELLRQNFPLHERLNISDNENTEHFASFSLDENESDNLVSTITETDKAMVEDILSISEKSSPGDPVSAPQVCSASSCGDPVSAPQVCSASSCGDPVSGPQVCSASSCGDPVSAQQVCSASSPDDPVSALQVCSASSPGDPVSGPQVCSASSRGDPVSAPQVCSASSRGDPVSAPQVCSASSTGDPVSALQVCSASSRGDPVSAPQVCSASSTGDPVSGPQVCSASSPGDPVSAPQVCSASSSSDDSRCDKTIMIKKKKGMSRCIANHKMKADSLIPPSPRRKDKQELFNSKAQTAVRFSCEECGSDRFRSHRSFHTHLKSHHLKTSKVYGCQYCLETFGEPQTKRPILDLSDSGKSDHSEKLYAEISLNTDQPEQTLTGSDDPSLCQLIPYVKSPDSIRSKLLECTHSAQQVTASNKNRMPQGKLRQHKPVKDTTKSCMIDYGTKGKVSARKSSTEVEEIRKQLSIKAEYNWKSSTTVPKSIQGKQCYQCSQCSYSSKRHMNYHRHLLRHQTSEEAVVCDHCHKVLCEAKLNGVHPTNAMLSYSCQVCEVLSSTHSEHHQHLQTAHQAGPCSFCPPHRKHAASKEYCCEKCGAKFNRHYGYHRHMVTHLCVNETGMCSYCQKVLCAENIPSDNSNPSLDARSATAETSGYKRPVLKAVRKGYECCQCDFRCTKKSLFQKHLKSHHSSSTGFQCSMCEFSAETAQGIKLHLRMAHNTNTKTCDFCLDAIYCDISQLMEHLKHVHGIHNFDSLCADCGRLFQHRSSFLKHQRSHRNNKAPGYPHVASPIAPSLNTDSREQCLVKELSDTNISGDASGQLLCTICSQAFPSLDELQVHQQKAHQIKPTFACDQCTCCFNRKWNLLRHKHIQHEKQLQCCHLCDYSTKSSLLLHKHYTKSHLVAPPSHIKMAAEGGKPRRKYKPSRSQVVPRVMCDICGQVLSKGMLKIHMNSHLGVRPYRCHHVGCVYTAVSSNGLASHIKRRHLGIKKNSKKWHGCSLCSYRTKEKSRFLSHLRSKHSQETTFPSVVGLNPGGIELQSISDSQALHGIAFLESVQTESMDGITTDAVGSLLAAGGMVSEEMVNIDHNAYPDNPCERSATLGVSHGTIACQSQEASSLTEGMEWTAMNSASSFSYLQDVIQQQP